MPSSPLSASVSQSSAKNQRYPDERVATRAVPEESIRDSKRVARVASLPSGAGEILESGQGLTQEIQERPSIDESTRGSTVYNVSSVGVDDTEDRGDNPEGLRSEVQILRRQVAILQEQQLAVEDALESGAPPSYTMASSEGYQA